MRIILTIILITFSIPVASAQEMPYNSAPKLVTYCEAGYIGYEYSTLKELRCKKLWGMWTRERLLEESDYFTRLDMNR